MKNSYQTLCAEFQTDRREQLVAHLSGRYHWSATKAHRAVDEYVMFLYVASLNVGVPLVPTCDIDIVWEADILQNTAQYMQTCQTLCGKIIHHAQSHEMKKLTAFESIEAAFHHTQTLWCQSFGAARSAAAFNGSRAAACGAL